MDCKEEQAVIKKELRAEPRGEAKAGNAQRLKEKTDRFHLVYALAGFYEDQARFMRSMAQNKGPSAFGLWQRLRADCYLEGLRADCFLGRPAGHVQGRPGDCVKIPLFNLKVKPSLLDLRQR